MKIKTENLIGSALDWAVAHSQNMDIDKWEDYHPSTCWEQCGELLEKEEINVETHSNVPDEYLWLGFNRKEGIRMYGSNPRIAAMRCYVAGKLGYDVDVPNKFLGNKI